MNHPQPDAEYSAFLGGPRTRAKQHNMLEIDVEFAQQWVETMTALVARELPDQEFTAARMLALHEWERARKRAQKSLHYRYDPLRRSRRLIERDTRRTLEQVREQGAELARRLEDAVARSSPTPERRRTAATKFEPTPTAHAGLSGIPAETRSMYERLAPELTLATATDDELRDAWTANNPGMSDEMIDSILRHLNDSTYSPPWS